MKTIPKILHIIWLGDQVQPDYFYFNTNKWKELMPDWDIKIWYNDCLTGDNIELSYLELINKAKKGAQKADLLRYYMVYKYGGFYVDSDITPFKSLDNIPTYHYSDVLCHDRPWVSWPYVINAFFGSKQKSELMKYTIDQMYNVDFNVENIHLTSGPGALGRSYFHLRDTNSIIMLPYFLFYRNRIGDIGPGDYVDSKYGVYLKDNIHEAIGHHTYAATWT
jgi:hypothetical protein